MGRTGTSPRPLSHSACRHADNEQIHVIDTLKEMHTVHTAPQATKGREGTTAFLLIAVFKLVKGILLIAVSIGASDCCTGTWRQRLPTA
jgi:hypothetical protein